MWNPLLKAAGEDFGAITYELPGHGIDTEHGAPESFDDLVRASEELLLREAQEPVVYCGVSLGGAIGVRLAADHPELIRALVVVNAPMAQPSPAFWHDRAEAVGASGLDPLATVLHERWFSESADTYVVEAVRRDFRSLPVAGYAAACRAIADLDVREAAGRVRVPAVVLSADGDLAVDPSNSAALAEAMPQAALRRVSGAHLLPAENPAEVLAAIHLAIDLSEEPQS
ncbi:alpha/beta fold hydrolase [Citricoccus parietis]